MNNNYKKMIARKLAISFFFAAIFILIVYIFFYEKIDYYTSLINTFAVNLIDGKGKEEFSSYPSFGEKYGNVIIDKIDVDLPLFHGDTLKILKYGLGHFSGSYFPGEGGTIIIAGHNTEPYLKRIQELEKDDKITINTTYGEFIYKITNIRIVNENDLNAFPIQDNKEILIMYTCYPFTRSVGRRTERYVIYADLVGENFE